MICTHCDTSGGEALVYDIGEPTSDIYKLATWIAYGEMRARIEAELSDLIDNYDESRGISAMMRTTGYSLSITGQMQARGEITPPGVHTPDECIPAVRYIEELRKRGVEIRISTQ